MTGSHLSRCLFYLDMNMVRAGVVAHPRQWRAGGYHELSGGRKRYRIIDQKRLLSCLAVPDVDAFRRWHEAALEELCQQDAQAPVSREPHWSQAFAVGSRSWLPGLTAGDPQVEQYIRPVDDTAEDDEDSSCVLSPPQSVYLRLWHRILGARRR